VKHLRSIAEAGPEGLIRLLDHTDTMVEVNERPVPKVPGAPRQDRLQPVLRGLHAHAAVVRDAA
jgi:hypothetical protein